MQTQITICSVENCGRTGKLKRGLCNMHYQRWWRANNPDRNRARGAVYDAAHREQRRAYQAVYRAAHREEQRATQAAYRATHREELRVVHAAYNAAHREKARAYREAHCKERRAATVAYDAAHRDEKHEREHRRRAQRRSQFVAAVNAQAIYIRDSGRCHICGRKVRQRDASMDHLVPLSRGGGHSPVNVGLAHLDCNLHRNAHGPAQLRML